MPHVILNQARINGLMIQAAREHKGAAIEYGYSAESLSIETEGTHPVKVTVSKNGQQEVIRAKYVLGCEGAHSSIRKALGYKMIGDSTDAVWGVFDVYPRTTFPDLVRAYTDFYATLKLTNSPYYVATENDHSLESRQLADRS